MKDKVVTGAVYAAPIVCLTAYFLALFTGHHDGYFLFRFIGGALIGVGVVITDIRWFLESRKEKQS